MRSKTILLLAFFMLIFTAAIFADSPEEVYQTAYKDIKPSVMRDTIGVLTINANWGWEPAFHVDDVQIPLCEKNIASFTDNGTISLQKNTTCLTSYGYGGTGSFRFPLIADTDNHCCIVVDPKTDKRIWINKKKLSESLENGFELQLFASLKNTQVDLFYFTDSKKKKLYVSPAKDSAFTVIDEKTHPVLIAAETKNGFVRLVVPNEDPESQEEPKSVGWARIRDNEGLMTIWLIVSEGC